MRKAMIGFLTLLSCISLGCHHNLAHNGCGGSCGSCGHSQGGCNQCGGLHDGEGLAIGSRLHDGTGIGSRLHGDGLHGDGLHGDGRGLGLRSGAPQHVARMPHGPNTEMMGPPGPPTGTYAYPYYTTRAPRDFLLNNPPSIGP
jgi:hypothetical protein